jgi:hypothetical protein
MTNLKKVSLLVIALLPLTLFGQQPEHQKKKYVDSLGRYYQQASLPVYFYVSTSLEEKPTQVLVDNKPEPIYLEGHGTHGLKHHNSATNKIETFDINADGLAPITRSTFSGAPTSTKPTMRYYGKGLQIVLKATDEMSGLEAVYHSLNDGALTKYSPIAPSQEGKNVYSYYAVDHVGNAEKIKTETFTIDLSAPDTYHNFVGISDEKIISTGSSMYLTSSDSLSGVASTSYHFDKEKPRLYVSGNIAFQYLADGNHTLFYNSIDKVNNIEEEKSFSFYLDKTAPIMSADILGDKFLVGEKVYFSGRTKLKLTAVDNKSGIKDIMYSINSGTFEKYSDPFYLPGKTGFHTVKYYANDKTSNTSKDNFEHTVGVIYVDLTGPALAHRFDGTTFMKADSLYTSPQSKIVLSANDPEAGLHHITYKIDGQGEEIKYTGPIAITGVGKHTIDYFGYDNVNNRNSKTFSILVDDQGPSISNQFSVAAISENKYPSNVSLFLAATDQQVGTLKIVYSINDGKETQYAAPLSGFQKDKQYTVKVTAIDLLGNKTAKEIRFDTGRY